MSDDTTNGTLPPLYRYAQHPHEDAALAMWWGRMAATGELTLTWGEQSTSLSRFYALLAAPSAGFYYRLTPEGAIGLGALVVPHLTNCAFLSLWLAPEWRMHTVGRDAMAETYDVLLTAFPVLLGVTRQERLLAIHRRWGYRILGQLPGVFDGHDAWVVVLTRDAFTAARAAGWPKPATDDSEDEWAPVADPVRSTPSTTATS